MMLNKKAYYNIQELAEAFAMITGKSIPTMKRAIYREIERGKIEGIYMLNSIMVPHDEAMAALKGKIFQK